MKLHTLILTLSALSFATPGMSNSFIIGDNLGVSCFNEAKLGRSDKDALATCNSAIQNGVLSRTDIAATYVNRGIVRSNRGDFDGAVADYTKALRLDPTLGAAFANRGNVYIRMNEYTKALHELNQALLLDLEQPAHVFYNRAIVHEHFGEKTKAYHDYKKATELHPTWQPPKTELMRFIVKTN
ncbi:MAG: tetratricopeptide repeat protein [Robiginitomaculum sp.]|nr:tetratricopeptide repeat protein [Robiginitomaculum sp.]